MSKFRIKMKVIFVPCIVLFTLGTALYTLLNWLLSVKFHVLSPDNSLNDVLLPIVLPILFLFIWLMPRLRLLYLGGGRTDSRSASMFVLCFMLPAIAVISQDLMRTANRKHYVVEHISQIPSLPASDYYMPRHFFVDRSAGLVHGESSVHGKGSEYVFDFYYVLPVFDDTIAALRPEHTLWLGMHFSESMSNDCTAAEKDTRWDEFGDHCADSINATDFNKVVYMEREGDTEAADMYDSAIATLPNGFYSKGSIVLRPSFQPFAAQVGDGVMLLSIVFVAGFFIFFLIVAFTDVDVITYEWMVR